MQDWAQEGLQPDPRLYPLRQYRAHLLLHSVKLGDVVITLHECVYDAESVTQEEQQLLRCVGCGMVVVVVCEAVVVLVEVVGQQQLVVDGVQGTG